MKKRVKEKKPWISPEINVIKLEKQTAYALCNMAPSTVFTVGCNPDCCGGTTHGS